ncbi:KLC4 [Branchiostoma lanceolatum]|uniref:KLC4 protein n=1 Tax=Branchiostoma lanceolatum TaxID=7740 RepID=A0A8J9VRQ9_BRALA|nr:KLC4 [Branchiostoma lanceolatum]
MKSLGDLRLQKGKLSKDSAEFDKAAALYAAALLRCTDPDMGQTLEHRIGYMERLCRQLLQGYTPRFQTPDYSGTRSNVLRVAESCDKLDKRVAKPWQCVEDTYTETLVTAITNGDKLLELECLKCLGDFYLEKGKKTCDLSQFTKAAAMYGKALARCEDPETKQTLRHHVLYIVEIWGAVKRRLSSKSTQRGKRPDTGQQPRDSTRTESDAIHNQPLHPDIQGQYQDHLREGDSSLSRADLDSAEQHFAAALRTVHVRDPTAQQYQREVEPLCKLGDVYSKRGQQTGDGGDFVKAAALYNAAIARSNNEVLNENHKKQLKEMRDQIKLEMETIDQQLDPYVHNEDDPCVKEIEAKRAQAVRQLFEKIAQQRKEFISQLVEECIGLMGPPPCKFALIGLGSQATGLVTPYSDLEFAMLVEEEIEPCLVYFRNLTHYLHLKVVNLGETILPALGIKSLNDFYSENPLESWYYDSVTPRGFAFDGSMPKASKTPLGRQGTIENAPSELICTPSHMVSILQNDAKQHLKKGYHLATILRNPCLIAGDQGLIDTYTATTVKILQADGAVAVDCLALSSGITPTTVWKTIEDMKKQKNNLGTACYQVGDHRKAIKYFEQAMQMYKTIHGQSTAHPDIATSFNHIGEGWFSTGDYRQAISYYEQALQMHRSIHGQSTPHPDIAAMLNNLGASWSNLGDHKKALHYFEQALQMRRSIIGQTTPHPDIAGTSLVQTG